jgi:hypothetical protein
VDTAADSPPVSASTANVAGNWRLSFPEGKKLKGDTTLSLAQKGAELSGTLHTAGGDLQVRGEVSGSRLTVSGRKIMTYTLRATLKGEQLEGTLEIASMTLHWIAQRIPAAEHGT